MKDEIERDLGLRTRSFALAVIGLYGSLPKSTVAQVLGRQLLRSGTSVGAHYREARRGKSVADFVSRIEGLLQELDESAYWIDLLHEARVTKSSAIKPLMVETDELMSIFVTVAKKAKLKLPKR
jgi:four helix bundle protein